MLPATTVPTELDAHGFDPSAYQWVPVLRRPRADGWTAQRQVEFIAALADYGCVEQAAGAVGMSVTSCYRRAATRPAAMMRIRADLSLTFRRFGIPIALAECQVTEVHEVQKGAA